MSNGTRIDPEEREPRAIKIRKPKHTMKKAITVLLFALLIVAVGGGAFAFIEYGPELDIFVSSKTSSSESSDSSVSEVSSSSSSSSETSSSEVESKPEKPIVEQPIIEKDPIPRDEWYMLLVNPENPLPENFSIEIAAIDSDGHTVDKRIISDLSDMISAAEKEGLDFIFYTAYRSVAKQKEFFEAGKTEAAPGTSEHNCGLAIDIGCANGDFEGSAEQSWLLEHSYEYGFILRYPKDKVDITGFAYEPWHFRYVGKEQAKLIFESGLCLEEYLALE